MRARHRRRVLLVFIVLWLTLGQVATYLWQKSVVWVNVQSDLAMLVALVGAYAAETPVEQE